MHIGVTRDENGTYFATVVGDNHSMWILFRSKNVDKVKCQCEYLAALFNCLVVGPLGPERALAHAPHW